ncbi:class I SAM-dependent methyltransferase [Ruminococcus flavefaciens]|nr:class I SAM-dependent methyltransferase [Ruminococcus flavefaciens]
MMINVSDALMYFKYYTKTIYLEILKACKGLDYTGRIESNISSLRGYEGCYPIKRLLKKLNINLEDRILDIGCGKGLSLYYSSMFCFERIDGIEYSKKLTKIAKRNARMLKDKRVHIYNCDARIFKHYEQYNYFFINNPFSSEIMEQVVFAIIQSYKIKKRRIIVIYQFPFSIDVFRKYNFKIIYKNFPNVILTFG